MPLEYVACFDTRESVILLRKLREKGSLRDVLNGKRDPKEAYTKKYNNNGKTSSARPFDIKLVAKAGKQILEALIHLKTVVGLTHIHLHTSNVLIGEGNCNLTDLENNFLGLPGHYTLWSEKLIPEVECFGYLLFELATGTEFIDENAKTKEEAYNSLFSKLGKANGELQVILRSIFEVDLLPDKSAPSLEDLLNQPFFSCVGPPLATLPSRTPQSKEKVFLKNVNKGTLALSSKSRQVTINQVIARHEKLAKLQKDKEILGASTPPPRPTKSASQPSGLSLKCMFGSSPPLLESTHQGAWGAPGSGSTSAYTSSNGMTSNPVAISSSTAGGAASNTPGTPGTSTKRRIKKKVKTKKTGSSVTVAPPTKPNAPPPPPPPVPKAGGPPPPPPPPGKGAPTPPLATGGRKNLLSSIEGFSKGGLKKTVTVDKSNPLLGSGGNAMQNALFNSPMLSKMG